VITAGRLRLETGGRPIHVHAEERGIEVHVDRPLGWLGSVATIRRSWRSLAAVPGAGEVHRRLTPSAPPLSLRLGSLPAIRLHPDPGPIGRWMIGRL
jgi:hypothetical protein